MNHALNKKIRRDSVNELWLLELESSLIYYAHKINRVNNDVVYVIENMHGWTSFAGHIRFIGANYSKYENLANPYYEPQN